MPDAIVIGAGPNGLAAANLLADAGWSVLVLEANDEPGGAVRTAEVTAPGFRNDIFSAFYPFGAASPVFRSLGLERHGLRWVHAPAVLAHPTPDGPAAVLRLDIDETAASLDKFASGDGDAWRELYGRFDRVAEPLLDAMLSPFPPIKASLKLGLKLRASALDFTRFAMLSARRMATESFRGEGGGLLIGGNAMHADISLEGVGSGALGWVLLCLGQRVGFPVPQGGAQRLIDALVSRLHEQGGTLQCDARVERVIVERGRAVGVELAGGEQIRAAKAVLADTDAAVLYERLVGVDNLPSKAANAIERFERGPGTVKIDWALSGPIPWADAIVADAGTVHLGDSLAEMSITSTQLAAGFVPDKPFVLVGQMTTADPTRSPAGTESAWAYAHVPNGRATDAGPDGITGAWDERETDAFVRRMEARIEAHAPGFGDRIIARHVFNPRGLEAANANLVGGDLSGGTAQPHQELIFRPISGLARAETAIKALYLASSSAHPGPGVHGACGANAARAALAHDRLHRRG